MDEREQSFHWPTSLYISALVSRMQYRPSHSAIESTLYSVLSPLEALQNYAPAVSSILSVVLESLSHAPLSPSRRGRIIDSALCPLSRV